MEIARAAGDDAPVAAPSMDAREPLLREYLTALGSGELARLAEILAPEYRDFNPLPGQFPGRNGVILKAMAFRADHPDAHIDIESIEVTPAGARATWTTTARGLNGAEGVATWRFTGVFEIDPAKAQILSSDVIEMALVKAP
ncbi:MAG: nuclear transport factor 2 family protein [Polyangiaceae bacterium]